MHIEIGTAIHGDTTKWIFDALGIVPEYWACIKTPRIDTNVTVKKLGFHLSTFIQECSLSEPASCALDCWVAVHDLESPEKMLDKNVISYGDGVRHLFIEMDQQPIFSEGGPYRRVNDKPLFHLAPCRPGQYTMLEVFTCNGVEAESALFYELFRSHPNTKLLQQSLIYERVGVSSSGYSWSSRLEERERGNVIAAHQIKVSPFSLDSLALVLQQTLMGRARVRLLTLEQMNLVFQPTQVHADILYSQHGHWLNICVPRLAELFKSVPHCV